MTRHTARTLLAPTAAAALIALAGVTSASAAQEAGPSLTAATSQSLSCSLERVGSQLVKCDNLTGNGVAAPGWVRSAGTGTSAANAGFSSALVTETQPSTDGEGATLTKFRRHGI